MSGMILSILSRRFCFSLVNLGQWRKKLFNVSVSKPQAQIGLSVSKKQCLNLYFLNDKDQRGDRWEKLVLLGG